jgi:hypothetical protein
MIKKHPYIWAGVIGLLVLLNLVRWIPAVWNSPNPSKKMQVGLLELNFSPPLSDGEKKVHRDLFSAVDSISPGVNPKPKSLGKGKAQGPSLPGPTPTPSSVDGSVAEISGGYRLMGTVSRGGKSQALIGQGSQLFQVAPGDSLADQYQVRSITESEVYLTDKLSGNTLKLRIWDSKDDDHAPTKDGTGDEKNN